LPITFSVTQSNTLSISGHNFKSNSSYKCLFDNNKETTASFANVELLTCPTPFNMTPNEFYLSLKIDNNPVLTFTNYLLVFYKNCSLDSCGEKSNLTRGYCRYGACNCLSAWKGDNCEILIEKPKLNQISSDIIIKEFNDVNLNFQLISGTAPVYYSFTQSPDGLQLLNSTSLFWPNAFSSAQTNKVVLQATNEGGSDYLTLNLIIKPSYKPALLNLVKNTFTIAPSYILISGTIRDVYNSSVTIKNSLPIVLTIRTNYYSTDIKVRVNTMVTGVFFYQYYPREGEHGNFKVFATHPFEPLTNTTGFIEFNIYGLNLNETNAYFTGFVENNYEKVFKLTNLNMFPLNNLMIDFSKSSNYDFNFFALNGNNFTLVNNSTIKDRLSTNDSIIFKVKFMPNIPIQGSIYLTMKCNESISILIQIGVNILVRYPVLTTYPTSLEFRILIGEKKFFDIDISNIGTLKASNLTWEFINKRHQFSIFDLSSSFDLEMNKSVKKLLSLQASPEDDEGFYDEKLYIYNSEVRYILPIKYFITQSNNVELNIAIEDEFTYFSPDKPFVSNVTVTIFSSATNYKETRLTDADGLVSFSNLNENNYNIYVKSEKHLSKSLVWQPKLSKNYLNIFVERITVRIIWTVVPKLFEDKYEIKLTSEYETFVPAPVVVIEPMRFDLAELETGLVDFITLKVTNYGLIRADNFQFSLPSNFEAVRLDFQTPFKSFNLSANSSIEIRINVHTDTNYVPVLFSQSRRKRSSGGSCADDISSHFEYKCGPINIDKTINIPISKLCIQTGDLIRTDPSGVIINSGPGGGGGPFTGSWDPPSLSFNIPCKPCVVAVIFCIAKSITKCYKVPVEGFACYATRTGPVCLKFVYTTIKCIYKIIKCPDWKYCKNSASRIYSPFIHQEEIADILADSQRAMENFYRIGNETYGDEEWMNTNVSSWFQNNFEPLRSEISDGGRYITQFEYDSLVTLPFPQNITLEQVRRLVERFNNTQYMLDKGKLESNSTNFINQTLLAELSQTFEADNQKAALYGYNSLYEWFLGTIKAFDNAPSQEGVCAKVKIVISQSVTLTREGFEAKLQIENLEGNPLTNISVVIFITRANDSSNATEVFSISKPALDKITSVNGNGVLETGLLGSSTWFLIPYKEAAESSDVAYLVSGTLSYESNGKTMKLDLSSEVITVKPEPRLELIYFLERYIESDDPFTPEIEPAVPFTLGLLIKNKGYGTANDLKLTSSQPEIVENEKGLLIDFKIENAFINNQQQPNSLNLNFGSLYSFEFKHVVWQLKTSLRGMFRNLNATYTNTNPNGDPRLSLIDKLEYNQLARLVKVDQPANFNDNYVDFLAISEYTLLPDRVYLSNVQTNILNVSYIENITTIQLSSSEMKLKIISNDTTTLKNQWFYTGLFVSSNLIAPNNKIFKILRNDGRVLPIENVWMRKFDKTSSVLNLFDYISSVNYDLIYEIQIRDLNFTEPETTTIPTTTSTTRPTSTTTTTKLTTTTTTTPLSSTKFSTSLISSSSTIANITTTKIADSTYSSQNITTSNTSQMTTKSTIVVTNITSSTTSTISSSNSTVTTPLSTSSKPASVSNSSTPANSTITSTKTSISSSLSPNATNTSNQTTTISTTKFTNMTLTTTTTTPTKVTNSTITSSNTTSINNQNTSSPTATSKTNSTSTISTIVTASTNKINTTLPKFNFTLLNQTATISPIYELVDLVAAASTSIKVSVINLKCSINCSSSDCSLLSGYANWYANNSNSNFIKIYNSTLSFNSTAKELYAIMPENIWKAYLNYKVFILFIFY
jgi:hypothetical protein